MLHKESSVIFSLWNEENEVLICFIQRQDLICIPIAYKESCFKKYQTNKQTNKLWIELKWRVLVYFIWIPIVLLQKFMNEKKGKEMNS